MVTVLGFKAKHVNIMRPNDGQEDTFRSDEQCIKTDLCRQTENLIFDDLLEQYTKAKLLYFSTCTEHVLTVYTNTRN